MSCYIGPPTWYVRRSGDTMTGNLNLGLNSLILSNGAVGGLFRSGAVAGQVLLRWFDDSVSGNLGLQNIDCWGNVTMQATKTVDGVDISEIKQAKILTGTYTGDGNDDRNINLGVNLAAKSNVYVVIKQAGAGEARCRIEYGQGDLGMCLVAGADVANTIQALTATGFQVGNDNRVNQIGVVFRYIVYWQEG